MHLKICILSAWVFYKKKGSSFKLLSNRIHIPFTKTEWIQPTLANTDNEKCNLVMQ